VRIKHVGNLVHGQKSQKKKSPHVWCPLFFKQGSVSAVRNLFLQDMRFKLVFKPSSWHTNFKLRTNLPPLVVAVPVIRKSRLDPLVYFPQCQALLSRAANRHADQLHVGIWRPLLVSIGLTLWKTTTSTSAQRISIKGQLLCNSRLELTTANYSVVTLLQSLSLG